MLTRGMAEFKFERLGWGDFRIAGTLRYLQQASE